MDDHTESDWNHFFRLAIFLWRGGDKFLSLSQAHFQPDCSYRVLLHSTAGYYHRALDYIQSGTASAETNTRYYACAVSKA